MNLPPDSGPNKKALSEKPETLHPTAEELSVLGKLERTGFMLSDRMNRGIPKRLMTFCQRHIGSLWIHLATYNLMNVFGIENVERADADRPLILVANHRSFFDMYTVSSVLFRRTSRQIELYFPVRAKFFYDNPIGWLVNLLMGWMSMYPPFFREAKDERKRTFDKFSMRKLVGLCSNGGNRIIGFHPEGRRNLEGGPYDMLPAQPGIGKIVHAARPQVIPVFIAGLGNNLPRQILGNWTGGERIRIWFGERINLEEFFLKPDRLRIHKEIADHLMDKVKELADKDREAFGQ